MRRIERLSALAALAVGTLSCGNGSNQAAISGTAPTDTVPVVDVQSGTGGAPAPPRQMRVRDQADKGAADLDLRQVLVTLDSGTVEAQFVVRGARTDNLIFSVFLYDDANHAYQLAWKRAAGVESAFLFDFGANEQTRAADTQIGGHSVALIALVPDLDLGSLRFYASAEGTNSRDPHTDYIPNQPRDASTTKTLKFTPSG